MGKDVKTVMVASFTLKGSVMVEKKANPSSEIDLADFTKSLRDLANRLNRVDKPYIWVTAYSDVGMLIGLRKVWKV